MNSEQSLLPPQQVTLQAPTAMSIMHTAVERGADIATLERLMALQKSMKEDADKAEFHAALNRAQSAMGRVQTDLTNPQTRSKYASYAALDRKVRPLYSKEGLSLSFDTGETPLADHVRILCYVTHSSGFSKTYHADMPNDGKGAKGGDVMTKTHATGAAMSYGMRYLLKMIFNIAVGEDDDDGNCGGSVDGEQLEYLANCKDLAELQRLFSSYYAEAKAAKNQRAMKALIDAKDARKAELR